MGKQSDTSKLSGDSHNQTPVFSTLIKNSVTSEELKSGIGFPKSFPFNVFPLASLHEYVMYHQMKTDWGTWVDQNFSNCSHDEGIILVEGANWGDWDAFGQNIRHCFSIDIRNFFNSNNIKLEELSFSLADLITETIMDKLKTELRLNNGQRDYQLGIICISKTLLSTIGKDLSELIAPLSLLARQLHFIDTFNSEMATFIKESKEIIYSGEYDNIQVLDKIIKESNKLNTQYNDIKSQGISSEQLPGKLYVSFTEEGLIRVLDIADPTSEHSEINIELPDISTALGTNIDFLKELTHITRKEKESFESNKMNRSLYRLQVIMTISLFTSLAALFSISFSQIEENWRLVVILIPIFAALTWGMYFFIKRGG